MGMTPDMFNFSEMPGLDMLEDVVITIFAIYAAIMLFASIYSIVVYVLHSAGLYAIAKRRLIHNPWLAWIPVANIWILGCISDHYQFMAKQKKTKRRKTLIGLLIALYAVVIVVAVAAGVIAGMAVVTGGVEQAIGFAVVLVVSYIAVIVLALLMMVFQYIAYYDLFASCNPDNATVFLVLGIFFNFLLPYFVFGCRKKDLGMPKAPEPQPEVPQYIPAPVSAEPEVAPADPEPEIIPEEPVAEEVVTDPADPVAEEKDFETEA